MSNSSSTVSGRLEGVSVSAGVGYKVGVKRQAGLNLWEAGRASSPPCSSALKWSEMDLGLSVRDASQKPDCPSNTITITFSHTPRARDKQRCDRAGALSVLYSPGPAFSKSQ